MATGAALLTFGLVFTRGNPWHLANLFAMVGWPIGVFAILGLALLGLAWQRLRSGSAGGVLALSMLIAAAIFVGFSGLGLYALNGGQQVDENRLANLKNVQLEALGGTVEAVADWPQWRGPHRDGRAFSPLRTSWEERPPTQLWRRPLGGGYSSIAFADGKLYTQDRHGNRERIVCLDPATGQDLWIHEYEFDPRNVQYDAGPRATPTIHAGKLYSVGMSGRFLCLDLPKEPGTPPTVRWTKEFVTDFKSPVPAWGFASSPLIEGNLVVVQPGGAGGAVAAFDKETGQLAWKALEDVNGYSSPIAATLAGVRQIVAFTGTGVVGVRATDGAKLWYYPWSTSFDCNIATPIAVGNYVFISSGYGAGCALLEITGDSAGQSAHPVYVKKNKLMRNHHSSCVFDDGFLYGYDSGPGLLKCINLRTGEEAWSTRAAGRGAVLFVSGYLLGLTEDGVLHLVEAKPEGFRALGKLTLFQTSEVWAVPTVVNGRLYARDKVEIVAYDITP